MPTLQLRKAPRIARTATLIATLPVWLPLILLGALAWIAGRWVIIRWHVWRPIESAWNKCAGVWLREGWVWIAWCDAVYSQGLQPALAKVHRRQRAYFLQQLSNPQPILAAYACLCLHSCGGIRQNEISNEVCERKEVLSVRGGDMIQGQTLGDFVSGLLFGEPADSDETGASGAN